MEKSFALDELIDLDELQSIQDSFAKALGISSVILSPEGETLTRFTNPTGFCSLIQSTKKGKERCIRSFIEMRKNAFESKERKIFYCFAHVGHFVAPIMINGECKGTMFAGQFIPEKLSCEQLHDLKEIAPEIDIDPELLVKEAEKIRVVGEDVIRNYSSLLFKIIETIARRGAQAAELIRTKDVLQRANDELEKRVQKRTAELSEANKGLKHKITERKLAEEKLQKERDRVQHYLDVARVMFIVIGDDRKVSLINKKGCEILGYEKEKQITGKNWFDNFVPERLRDEVARAFELLIAGEIEPVEYYENPVLTKHGEERIIAWHNTILKDEQGRIYATMASGEDITERKAAQKAIKESEEKYKTLFEFAMDGIMIADLETKRFKYANPAICKMLGYSAEELEGMSIRDIHPKNKLEHVISEFEAQAKGEKTLALDIPCLRKDGTIIYADINTTVALVDGKKCNIGFFRDNTEGKKAKQALRESEEKIRSMANSAQHAVIMMDSDGNISYWNKAAERIFGYTEEEVSGKELHALFMPERFHAGFSKGFEEFKETGQGAAVGKTLELAAVRKDGKEFPVELSLSALKLKDRWNAIGLMMDITERKAAEEEIKKKADELEKFNKLAVGREFKMIELKKEINALLEKLGEEPGYKIVGEPQGEVF